MRILKTLLCLLLLLPFVPSPEAGAQEPLPHSPDLEKIAGGDGWQRLRVTDLPDDSLLDPKLFGELLAAGATEFDTREIVIFDPSRIDEVPLDPVYQEVVGRSWSQIHRREAAEREARIAELEEKLARGESIDEAELREIEHSAGGLFGNGSSVLITTDAAIKAVAAGRIFQKGLCDSYDDRTWTKTMTHTIYSPPAYTRSETKGAVTAKLTVSPPDLVIPIRVDFRYRVHKDCGVITSVEPRNIRLRVEPSLTGGYATFDANASYSYTWSKEWMLWQPNIGSFWLWVGVIPVRLEFSLPLRAGASFDAKAAADLNTRVDLVAGGVLDYTCSSSCSGSRSFSLSLAPRQPTLEIQGKATGKVWFRPGLRVALYEDVVGYAEGTVKTYLQGDLWGYSGNGCGDGNNDGTREWVNGLTFDASRGYDLVFGVSGMGSSRNFTLGGPKNHMYLMDLLSSVGGSSALRPMVWPYSANAVDGSLNSGESGTWATRMRPCYPFTERVNYSVTPSTRLSPSTFSASPTSTQYFSGSFTSDTTIRVYANSDSKGRTLNQRTNLWVNILGNGAAGGGGGGGGVLLDW